MSFQNINIPSATKPPNPAFKDLEGQRFTRLLVLHYVIHPITGKSAWFCKCDCGNTTVIRTTDLTSGRSRSCKCLQRDINVARLTTHGASKSPTYQTWESMSDRCNNPRNDHYKNYGGRGISICGRWQSFSNFLEDVGERPSGHTLDRVDNSGNYEPDNVRWATIDIQANNRRTNHLLTYKGKTQTMAMWAKELHLNYTLIQGRLRWGWSVERIFTTPTQRRLS